jgi:hypothetical protein
MAFKNGNKEPYKHKTNRGSMFDNDRKTKETQPDFTGSIDVNGTVFWINGWTGMTQNGKRKLSLSVQPQEERHPQTKHDDEQIGWGGNLPKGSPPQKPTRGGW